MDKKKKRIYLSFSIGLFQFCFMIWRQLKNFFVEDIKVVVVQKIKREYRGNKIIRKIKVMEKSFVRLLCEMVLFLLFEFLINFIF